MNPPTPLVTTDINPNKLAAVLKEARTLQVIDGPDVAQFLAARIFPNDPRRALQFVNLADPAAHNAA